LRSRGGSSGCTPSTSGRRSAGGAGTAVDRTLPMMRCGQGGCWRGCAPSRTDGPGWRRNWTPWRFGKLPRGSARGRRPGSPPVMGAADTDQVAELGAGALACKRTSVSSPKFECTRGGVERRVGGTGPGPGAKGGHGPGRDFSGTVEGLGLGREARRRQVGGQARSDARGSSRSCSGAGGRSGGSDWRCCGGRFAWAARASVLPLVLAVQWGVVAPLIITLLDQGRVRDWGLRGPGSSREIGVIRDCLGGLDRESERRRS
jgi:hypothetical protein